MKPDVKILVCAGGTGGGIYPALAVVNALLDQGVPRNQILWVGVKGEMEEQLVPRAGLTLETISGGPIVGVSRLMQLRNGGKLLLSIFQSLRLIGRFRPHAVFVTGGYMSVPVALAARLRRIASIVYLPDLEPGSALRLIGRFVTRVTATFPESVEYFPTHKSIVATGYPVRPELIDAARLSKAAAITHFDLDPARPVLFVFGGSRGAWSINQALMGILPDLLLEMQVIHISGTLTWDKVAAFAATLPTELRQHYRPYAYLHEDMGTAFRAATLVVARAGASMLGELPLFGIPAILVPYPHAWRYQKVNADYLVDRDAAIRMEDESLPTALLPTIRDLLHNKRQYQQMVAAAERLRQTDAANRLATVILTIDQSGSHD